MVTYGGHQPTAAWLLSTLGISLVGAGSSSGQMQTKQLGCPALPGWAQLHGGDCIFYSGDERLTQPAAALHCGSMAAGSHLASLLSDAEAGELLQVAGLSAAAGANLPSVWTGGLLAATGKHQWVWPNGSKVTLPVASESGHGESRAECLSVTLGPTAALAPASCMLWKRFVCRAPAESDWQHAPVRAQRDVDQADEDFLFGEEEVYNSITTDEPELPTEEPTTLAEEPTEIELDCATVRCIGPRVRSEECSDGQFVYKAEGECCHQCHNAPDPSTVSSTAESPLVEETTVEEITPTTVDPIFCDSITRCPAGKVAIANAASVQCWPLKKGECQMQQCCAKGTSTSTETATRTTTSATETTATKTTATETTATETTAAETTATETTATETTATRTPVVTTAAASLATDATTAGGPDTEVECVDLIPCVDAQGEKLAHIQCDVSFHRIACPFTCGVCSSQRSSPENVIAATGSSSAPASKSASATTTLAPAPDVCSDGETDTTNPCEPKDCVNGEWIMMVVDCAELMGVPCEGGQYVKPAEGACCSTCVRASTTPANTTAASPTGPTTTQAPPLFCDSISSCPKGKILIENAATSQCAPLKKNGNCFVKQCCVKGTLSSSTPTAATSAPHSTILVQGSTSASEAMPTTDGTTATSAPHSTTLVQGSTSASEAMPTTEEDVPGVCPSGKAEPALCGTNLNRASCAADEPLGSFARLTCPVLCDSCPEPEQPDSPADTCGYGALFEQSHSRGSGVRFSAMLERSKQIPHEVDPAQRASVSEADYTAECGCACDGAADCAGFAVRASATFWICYLVSATEASVATVLDVASYARITGSAADDTCHIESDAASVAEMIELLSHYTEPVSSIRYVAGGAAISRSVQPALSSRDLPGFKVDCLRSCCQTQHCNAAYIVEESGGASCSLFKRGATASGETGPSASLMYARSGTHI